MAERRATSPIISPGRRVGKVVLSARRSARRPRQVCKRGQGRAEEGNELAGWEQRVSTGQLNTWLNALVAATPPPMRGGKQPRVLFATQAGTRPPHFVLFTTGFLEETYRRFIERRLREEFGFEGSPVQVTMRLREKRSGKSRPGGRAGAAGRRS